MKEKWIEYLFSRFHHLLGFEKVITFQNSFPDVVALREGVETKIELESKLEHIGGHYTIYHLKKWHNRYWVYEGNDIVEYDTKRDSRKHIEVKRYPNSDNNKYFEEYGHGQRLRRKSLKPDLDVIICWKIHHIPILLKEDENFDELEIIDLNSKLEEMGVSW